MKEFDFEKVPIVEIANEILLDGVKKGASDIHFDPTKDGINIRMRVDGVLYDYAKVPADFKRNMISRIKMIASMNIMETRLPQDGAIKSKIGDKMLDLRVSSLPTHTGEKVVLRILDYSKSLQGLETLGFSEHNLKKIMKMIDMPNGIVLVTGATGSGKSTTVYSILQRLNTREVNIITVEDPVEMEVEGLNQVQAQQEIGLDFATVLRSILRQDPDIIMIGEIRDGETASIAVRASITGHKVLSTIHTNSALNTIERLTDMGVERYLIGTSLNGVISQKLARKLCPNCRITRETNDYEKQLFRKVLHKDVDKIYDINPDGCEHCFKGYKGRICIAEVLVITDEVRTGITNAEPKDVMRKQVYIDAHTHTLLEDGLEKVVLGETNFDEILKLVDLENDLAIHNAFYDEVEKNLKEGKNIDGEEIKPKEENQEIVKAETKPEEVKPVVTAQPTTTAKPEEVKPVVTAQPTTTAKPEEVKPVATAQIAAVTKPEEVKPVTTAQPVTAAKPEEVKPVATAQSATASKPEEVKPVATAQPATVAKPEEVKPVATIQPATVAKPEEVKPVATIQPATVAKPEEVKPVATAKPVAATISQELPVLPTSGSSSNEILSPTPPGFEPIGPTANVNFETLVPPEPTVNSNVIVEQPKVGA